MDAHRLTDEQYLQFLTDGYVTMSTAEMSEADHDQLYREAARLYQATSSSRNPHAHLEAFGDNLRARIPVLELLLQDPAVSGALSSVLGDDYLVHPHHYVHVSLAADQPFHQDGNLPWNERGHYRPHRPDWALLFYYPQEVTLANGPTEVIPGSQYWTTDFEKPDGSWYPGDLLDKTLDRKQLAADDLEQRDRVIARGLDMLGVPGVERRFLTVPKGAFVVSSYDIVHRGSRTQPDQPPRFMYKFYFARTHVPAEPAWKGRQVSLDLTRVRRELEGVVRYIWRWSGGRVAEAETMADAAGLLSAGREDQKVAAAYALAEQGDADSLATLRAGLDSEIESTRRASAYGLRAAGQQAVPALVELTRSSRASVRRLSLFALGNVENAGSAAVVDALLQGLEQDSDDLARSNAAYALGQLLRSDHSASDLSAVVDRLLMRLEEGVEPHNTELALLSRSTVRQSVAYALLQAAANGHVGAAQAEKLVSVAVDDKDRYVQGFAVESLLRLRDTPPEALARALRLLFRMRYSPPPPA